MPTGLSVNLIYFMQLSRSLWLCTVYELLYGYDTCDLDGFQFHYLFSVSLTLLFHPLYLASADGVAVM